MAVRFFWPATEEQELHNKFKHYGGTWLKTPEKFTGLVNSRIGRDLAVLAFSLCDYAKDRVYTDKPLLRYRFRLPTLKGIS